MSTDKRQAENVPQRVVLISHPVHQHAYETAVAAQETGLLRAFVTGMYYTKRGALNPRVRRRLPGRLQAAIERELMRRWHDDLSAEWVYTIPQYHAVATGLRRTSKYIKPVSRLELGTWAHSQFDRAVARLLPRASGLRIVHAFEGSSLETFRAAKRLGLTTVLDVASAHEYHRAVLGKSAARARLTRIRSERELADYVFAPSDYVIDCLVENGVPIEKIAKIPYGVDHVRFSPTIDSKEQRRPFRVVFVGSITPAKGVHYLLTAWRALALPDAELVLVGQPDHDGHKILRDFEREYIWAGAPPKYAVDEWFRRSDVCVLPSLSDGWGLVLTEAMACGLPVVTTSTTGAPVRNGIDGFVVAPRDVSALQTKIRFLYDSPEARRKMGRRGREHVVAAYTWQHYRARVAKAYELILSASPSDRIADVHAAVTSATSEAVA